MINELDPVVLTRDFPEHGLVAGDVGCAVHVHDGTATFEVEFVAADGNTIALLTLGVADVRPLDRHEIMHARKWQERLSA